MKAPNVIVSNLARGDGSIVFSCDVRVELVPDLVLVVRDVRLIANSRGGHFVGLPRRSRGEWIDLVSFEGESAEGLYAAIRAAMKAQLATLEELHANGGADENGPF